jgi:hypothetical protein
MIACFFFDSARRVRWCCCVLAVGVVVGACGGDEPGAGIRPRDDGGDDDAGDSGDNGGNTTLVEDLSIEELSAICAPYKVERDSLLSEDDALESFQCLLSQFMSTDGGDPPTPPDSADTCAVAQAECLSEPVVVVDALAKLFDLDCDSDIGVAAQVAVYTGNATVADFEDCLAQQQAERARVLSLDCGDLLVSLSPVGFATVPSCATLGLAD